MDERVGVRGISSRRRKKDVTNDGTMREVFIYSFSLRREAWLSKKGGVIRQCASLDALI